MIEVLYATVLVLVAHILWYCLVYIMIGVIL